MQVCNISALSILQRKERQGILCKRQSAAKSTASQPGCCWSFAQPPAQHPGRPVPARPRGASGEAKWKPKFFSNKPPNQPAYGSDTC